ncbi:hypothetical protein QQF64_007169 [Cirrhinus molitorella]|uniref:Uncharacterized protein n=1 Tax=Cirrhinus molitorella TaxID=172907 RepID=A0ABR3M9W4_9TELE
MAIRENMEASRSPLYIILHLSHLTLPLMGAQATDTHRAAEARTGAAGIPLLVELKPARAVTARGLEQ